MKIDWIKATAVSGGSMLFSALGAAGSASANEFDKVPFETREHSAFTLLYLSPEEAKDIYQVLQYHFPPPGEDSTAAQRRTYNTAITRHFASEVQYRFRHRFDNDLDARAAGVAFSVLYAQYRIGLFSPVFDLKGNGPFNGVTPAVIPPRNIPRLHRDFQNATAMCAVGVPVTDFGPEPWIARFTRHNVDEISIPEHKRTQLARDIPEFVHFHEIAHCYGADELHADYTAARQFLRQAQNDPSLGVERAIDSLHYLSGMRLYSHYAYGFSRADNRRYQAFGIQQAILDHKANPQMTEAEIWALDPVDPDNYTYEMNQITAQYIMMSMNGILVRAKIGPEIGADFVRENNTSNDNAESATFTHSHAYKVRIKAGPRYGA